MLTACTADQKSERRARSFLIPLQSLAAAGLLSAASPSQAQAPSPGVQLEFTSEAPCPDRVAFMRSVEARVGRSLRWEQGEFAFQVKVRRQGEEFHGHLLARSGQYVTERDLTGKNCADVVAGLALVAALTLDPNASTAPQPAQPGVPGTPPAEAPAPAAPTSPTPQPTAQKPPAPPAAPPPSLTPPAPLFPPQEESPGSFAISALGTLGVDSGPAPVALIAFGPKVLAELYSDSIWQPSFGLAFAYAKTGVLGGEDPAADFRWLVVRLSACPLGSEIVREGRLRACVLGDIGSMSAEGRPTPVRFSDRTSQFWAATGAGATFSYHPVSPLFVEAGAGLLLAWTRPTYVFVGPPEEVVHNVPLWAFTAQIGVGVSFSDQ